VRRSAQAPRARRACHHGGRERVQPVPTQRKGRSRRDRLSHRGNASHRRPDRRAQGRAASQRRPALPELSLLPRGAEADGRLRRTPLLPCLGEGQGRAHAAQGHQADEGRSRRRGETGRRDQGEVHELLQGVTETARLDASRAVLPLFAGALFRGPSRGLLHQLYRAARGADPDVVLFDIYTFWGLAFAICCYTFPYVFVLVANALDRIPADLEDASSMLGGSAARTARKVTIPLALPALLAGALVAFLQTMTLFGSPAILALPAGFHVITTKIWSLFQYPPKPELAAAASLPLLLLTVVLLRAQAKILGRRGYTVVGGKSGEVRPVALGGWRWPAFAFCFAVLCLSVLLP